MLLRLVCFMLVFLFLNCKDSNNNLFEVPKDLPVVTIDYTDISKAYFDLSVNNDELRNKYPDFFESIEDSILNKRKTDSLGLILHQEVEKTFGNTEFLKDTLPPIYSRLKYFYPELSNPKVFSFTGELPYTYPVIFVPKDNTTIIGLDWFLGSEYEFYKNSGIPAYWSKNMTPVFVKPKVVEAIAKQVVPFDIRKSKFVERMIYEGKQLIFQDALLPQIADSIKIGYTAKQMEWLENNEPNVYVSFTEQGLFFSEDKKLKERFIDPAPFSKFYSAHDRETPGRLGAWVGWQICRAYIRKHPDVTFKDFIENQDLLQIFKESGYKPEFD